MNHREELPEDVTRFILLGIPSVPYLEALLLLVGDPEARWDHRKVAQRLYLGEAAAQALLKDLVCNEVAAWADEATSHVHYQPKSETVAAMISRLAEIYPRNLIAVTHLIHGRGSNRRAQQFADAFVLRKDPT